MDGGFEESAAAYQASRQATTAYVLCALMKREEHVKNSVV